MNKTKKEQTLRRTLPRYWSVSRRKQERICQQVRALQQRQEEQAAENLLREQLHDEVMDYVASELPFSLDATREDVRMLAAELYSDDLAYQKNPQRFRKIYWQEYRHARQFWRSTRSIWGGSA